MATEKCQIIYGKCSLTPEGQIPFTQVQKSHRLIFYNTALQPFGKKCMSTNDFIPKEHPNGFLQDQLYRCSCGGSFDLHSRRTLVFTALVWQSLDAREQLL